MALEYLGTKAQEKAAKERAEILNQRLVLSMGGAAAIAGAGWKATYASSAGASTGRPPPKRLALPRSRPRITGRIRPACSA